MLDKNKIKENLTIEDIYLLLESFGGNPERKNETTLICDTICHNRVGEGSHKLYYYQNDNMGIFHCYTGCAEPSFDIFDLVIKVMNIQKRISFTLEEAINFVLKKLDISSFGYGLKEEKNNDFLDFLDSFDENVEKKEKIVLKEYDDFILNQLKTFRIPQWEKEGISYETLLKYNIKYYPVTNKIIIPHYDINNRLVGIRGRAILEEDAARFGKYTPLILRKDGEKFMYNHPLGFSLYGLNFNKENIKKSKLAIIFEGEKSVLAVESILDNNISVAACGSSVTAFQIEELLDLGVTEICIAFDRQYEKLYTQEYNNWVNKIEKLAYKYNKFVNISFILDIEGLLDYKDSPTDKGAEVFKELFSKRFFKKG